MNKSHFENNKITLRDEAASLAAHRADILRNHALSWHPSRLDFIALLLAVSVIAWFGMPLMKLFALASENEHFSHLLLVPILTIYLLYSNRMAILTSRRWNPFVGLMVMGSGAVCYWLVDGKDWAQDRLTVELSAFVVLCWGLFLFSFGGESFRNNLFALMMLLFMIPLPTTFLDAVIAFLQRGSADVVELLFSTLGIQAVREGFTFELSNFIILVEEECSGIRSFFALVITSLIAGHWLLTSGWARATLVAVVVPLAIIKNAFRIVGLALLANYIDPTYITNSVLHRSGGIPLFLLSLVLLFGVVWVLRRYER